jgi:hypothetical protein
VKGRVSVILYADRPPLDAHWSCKLFVTCDWGEREERRKRR